MAERVRRHLLSQLLCLGRHTLTGVLGTSGRLFCDWSADYRMYSARRVDPRELFRPVRRALAERLAPGQPLVVALDDTRLRKSGNKTPGVKYVRDPLGPPFHVNFIKAQRFVQLSMAVPAGGGMARMVPVDFTHAPAPCKPRPRDDEAAWAEYRLAQRRMALPRIGAERLAALRRDLDEDGQADRPLRSSVDGGYTNGTFLKLQPPRTTPVGRIRGDAKLHHLPPAAGNKTGRKPDYGERAPTPEELRQDDSAPWQRIEAFASGKTHAFKIKTLGPLRWRPAGKDRDLLLVVVAPLGYRLTQGSRLLYRKPAYLICTDPAAALQEILQTYLWRWDVEVNFRDEKTLLGVGQAQVRHENSVEPVPALAVAAYAMLLAAAHEAYGPAAIPAALPPPKWRNKTPLRASTQSLLRHLRHEAWAQAIRFSGFKAAAPPDTKPQKLADCLESALFYATA